MGARLLIEHCRNVDDVIRAWTATQAGMSQEEIDRRILGLTAMVRAIAEGSPVSPERYATATGLPPERVSELFKDLSAAGVQFDAEGNLVGAGLTPLPTPHRFRVKGRDLYAWCALDTLFLPGLLGETAEVWSTCPTTGDEIRLTVSPEAEVEYTPREAVVTIVVPGSSTPTGATGPASPT